MNEKTKLWISRFAYIGIGVGLTLITLTIMDMRKWNKAFEKAKPIDDVEKEQIVNNVKS